MLRVLRPHFPHLLWRLANNSLARYSPNFFVFGVGRGCFRLGGFGMDLRIKNKQTELWREKMCLTARDTRPREDQQREQQRTRRKKRRRRRGKASLSAGPRLKHWTNFVWINLAPPVRALHYLHVSFIIELKMQESNGITLKIKLSIASGICASVPGVLCMRRSMRPHVRRWTDLDLLGRAPWRIYLSGLLVRPTLYLSSLLGRSTIIQCTWPKRGGCARVRPFAGWLVTCRNG